MTLKEKIKVLEKKISELETRLYFLESEKRLNPHFPYIPHPYFPFGPVSNV